MLRLHSYSRVFIHAASASVCMDDSFHNYSQKDKAHER